MILENIDPSADPCKYRRLGISKHRKCQFSFFIRRRLFTICMWFIYWKQTNSRWSVKIWCIRHFTQQTCLFYSRWLTKIPYLLFDLIPHTQLILLDILSQPIDSSDINSTANAKNLFRSCINESNKIISKTEIFVAVCTYLFSSCDGCRRRSKATRFCE